MKKTLQSLRTHLGRPGHGLAPAALSMIVAALIVIPPAQGQTLTTLLSFNDGGGGGFPESTLIRDAKGNFYGTTYAGGVNNCFDGCGVAFKLDKAGNESVLYMAAAPVSVRCTNWTTKARKPCSMLSAEGPTAPFPN